MMDWLTFKPLYQERVWGGRDLEVYLNRTLPGATPIGESWEVVDRPEAQSVVATGPLTGMGIRELLQAHAAEVMGPEYPADKPFPILVKWLDCKERLSLQVHPPAGVAEELQGEPKTENWYILEATQDAAVMAGLKAGVDRATVEAALQDNTLESLIPRLPTKAGDSLFVHSGRLHAIDGGNLILEVQQNSDTTYRVYDWGRVGLDGKPRQLHIEESLRSIDYEDTEPSLIHEAPGEQLLVDSPIFRLRKIDLAAGESLDFAAGVQPRLLHMAHGTLEDNRGRTLLRGKNALLPYDLSVMFKANEDTRVLITDRFV